MRTPTASTAADDGGLQLLSTPVAIKGEASPPQSLRVVCAWCEQRERIDGQWLPARGETGHLSHGICPDCLSANR